MSTAWLDFTAIKRQVPIRDVLAHYGFLEGLKEVKPGKLVGACPIHHGTGKASFHVDCGKSIWNCFSTCNGGGNILDLVMKVEGCSIREAGEKLAEWFDLTFDRDAKRQNSAKVSGKTDADSVPAAAHTERRVDVINPPLERPLRNLNTKHPYLAERGLAHEELIAHFGIGVCSVGLMRGRLAIPLCEEANGVLVGYVGRAVDEELAIEKGKYRFPPNLVKSALLYHLHEAKEYASSGVVLVEGFMGVMRLWAAGYKNAVALMGSSMSEEQERLLVAHANRVALMFDGDDAGRACSQDCLERLKSQMYVKEVRLDDGEQPDSIRVDRLRAMLG